MMHWLCVFGKCYQTQNLITSLQQGSGISFDSQIKFKSSNCSQLKASECMSHPQF